LGTSITGLEFPEIKLAGFSNILSFCPSEETGVTADDFMKEEDGGGGGGGWRVLGRGWEWASEAMSIGGGGEGANTPVRVNREEKVEEVVSGAFIQ